MNDDELSKVIVALDNQTPEEADQIIKKWKYRVHAFKVNHVLYPYIQKNHRKIFCDFKLYDIPNTMCNVIEHLIETGAYMVTINMNNNLNSMEAISKYSDKIKLLGVTALTSWDNNEPQFIHNQSIGKMFDRSVWIMEKYGFYGMICSPKDLLMIKDTKLKKITPGIRFKDDLLDDQVRVTTPTEAFEKGSDFLVMGRSFLKYAENI